MHEGGFDIPQDPGVVGDEHHSPVSLGGVLVDTLGDDAQGINVEPRVGLVKDRGFGVEQFKLRDLVALLLTT